MCRVAERLLAFQEELCSILASTWRAQCTIIQEMCFLFPARDRLCYIPNQSNSYRSILLCLYTPFVYSEEKVRGSVVHRSVKVG